MNHPDRFNLSGASNGTFGVTRVMKGGILTICLIVFGLGQTAAQVLEEPSCKQEHDVTASIDRISMMLAKVATSIESVPTSAAQSLKAEARKALEQRGGSQSDLVVSHPFYFALKFHDNVDIAERNLGAAKTAGAGKDRARYLVVVLLRLTDVASDMEGYIDFDLKRTPTQLSDGTRSTMRSDIQTARVQTTALIQCVIDQL